MNLQIITLFTVLLVHTQHAETFTLFPQSIIDNFKRLYVNNFKNKISSFFGFNNNSTATAPQENSAETVKKKVSENDTAVAETSEVLDVSDPWEFQKALTEDDPSVHMSTPQLIALHGYLAESHTIVTDDGYILTIHRIPHSKKNISSRGPRKTVLLHHGFLGSSADWVIPGPNKALAYILSDAGYDVWLANARGNTYSRAHISRSIESFAYWNFTFHEVSQHDLPAVIDYIMETKGWDVKINYIGHSMGTTVLFALLSTKTHYNKVLRAGFALAPVAYMSDIRSPIRLLARFADNFEYLLKLLGANDFLPQNYILKWLSKYLCEINHYEQVICENSMFVLCGYDQSQFNRTLLPIILGHVPAGASTKTVVHYAQEIQANGRFQQFDYGRKGNLRQYGTETPPAYPLHKITLPIALLSSQNDWLAGQADVTKLYVQLRNPIANFVVPYPQFNHVDFLFAKDAPKLVYAKLLELLDDGNTPNVSTIGVLLNIVGQSENNV